MEPVLSDPEEETRTEESETIESMSELESNASNSSEPGDDFETASDSSSKIAGGSRWVSRMLGLKFFIHWSPNAYFVLKARISFEIKQYLLFLLEISNAPLELGEKISIFNYKIEPGYRETFISFYLNRLG